MGKLKTYQEQFQDVIESGINRFEEQYKSLSAKPFDFAEKMEAEARSYSVKAVRERHDEYLTSLYESLRSLNKRLNGYASELVTRIEREVKEDAEAVEKAAKPVGRKQPARKSNASAKTASVKKSEAATA